jgi:DNA repair protein RecO (recombination protein O)
VIEGVRFEPGAFCVAGATGRSPLKSSVDCNDRRCYPEIMLSCRCEAIVLGVMDYREADKIVTLFTLEQGKIKGMARGAKRSVRRFGGALELFARLKLEIGIKEGLAQLHTADIVSVFPRIREDLVKIGHAGYACELTDALLPEGACNPRLFRLLTSYLEHLERFPAASSDRRFFELNLLNVLGYRPALEQCAECAAELGGAFFRPAAAACGLLCSRCGRGGSPVSAATITHLRQSLATGRFGVISFTPAGLDEAGRLLDAAIAAHIQRPLNALSFLREMGE